MADFTIESHVENAVGQLSLAGEFDLAGIEHFEAAIDRLEAGDPPAIVIDLSALTFMDSSGLRALVMADQRAHNAGRRIAIVPGQPSGRRGLQITQFDGTHAI